MSTRRRITAATATAGALTLAIASIATATPIDLNEGTYHADTGNTRWEAYADGGPFSIDEATIYDKAPSAADAVEINNDAFDGVWEIWVDGEIVTYYGGSGNQRGVTEEAMTAEAPIPPFVVDVTTTAAGDIIVQGPVESHAGLNVTVQHRYYADGDLARVLVTYTNPSAAPITVTTGTDSNLGSDQGTYVEAESSGNGVVDTTDRWMVTSEDDPTSIDPVITTAWAGPGAGVALSGIDYEPGYMTTGVELTVAPGATVALAYFSLLNGWTPEGGPTEPPIQPPLQGEEAGAVVEAAEAAEADVVAEAAVAADFASAVTAAIADASEFASFSGRLTAGIPSGTRVLNWGTVGGASPATPVVGAPRFTG